MEQNPFSGMTQYGVTELSWPDSLRTDEVCRPAPMAARLLFAHASIFSCIQGDVRSPFTLAENPL
jgi:hypothetical protein